MAPVERHKRARRDIDGKAETMACEEREWRMRGETLTQEERH